eukprot:SAG11_NODE_27554_length_331_cov_0.896552_1_plen_40_part_10
MERLFFIFVDQISQGVRVVDDGVGTPRSERVEFIRPRHGD